MNTLPPRSFALNIISFVIYYTSKTRRNFHYVYKERSKINPTPFEWKFLKEGRVMGLHHVLSRTTENKVQKAVMR